MMGLLIRRWRRFGWLFVTPALLATACTHKPLSAVPDAPPPAVQVLVPIAKPCKVEKVEPTRLVTEELGVGDELFEAVKRVLADRELLLADRTKLVAANSDPCPQPKAQTP